MVRHGPIPLAPLEHRAAEVVGRALGRTLTVWPATLPDRILPATVTGVDHLVADAARPRRLSGLYDSVLSVGGLGSVPDLREFLRELRGHLAPEGVVHFCDPTIAADQPTSAPPHDVTGSLWGEGFTVFECRRFRFRHRFTTHEYCWGRARLTPIR